jgi:hypothetical protein
LVSAKAWVRREKEIFEVFGAAIHGARQIFKFFRYINSARGFRGFLKVT